MAAAFAPAAAVSWRERSACHARWLTLSVSDAPQIFNRASRAYAGTSSASGPLASSPSPVLTHITSDHRRGLDAGSCSVRTAAYHPQVRHAVKTMSGRQKYRCLIALGEASQIIPATSPSAPGESPPAFSFRRDPGRVSRNRAAQHVPANVARAPRIEGDLNAHSSQNPSETGTAAIQFTSGGFLVSTPSQSLGSAHRAFTTTSAVSAIVLA